VGAEFCANDSTNPGSLPNGSPVYNLGTATESHSNTEFGTGTISFVLVDSNNAFRVSIVFFANGLLNSTQMDNIPGPCDLVVSNFNNVTYVVEKPLTNVIDSGIITCFQLRSCSMLANLYGCQTACLTAKNGFNCNSPSASQSFFAIWCFSISLWFSTPIFDKCQQQSNQFCRCECKSFSGSWWTSEWSAFSILWSVLFV